MSIRQTPSDEDVEACLDFTPVPRLHNRHDGWTAERQRAFIAALARLGTVKAAAAAVGMAAVGAYHLRRQKGAEEFARAWARAHAAGVAYLRDVAYDRAVNGIPKGVWHKGERVGEERNYNDRLLMFMLRRENPATDAPLKPLRPGTRHPVTIEREARWAAEREVQQALPAPDPFDDPPPPEPALRDPAEEGSVFRELLDLYVGYAHEMQRARRSGDVSTADFEAKRMVAMEIAIVLGNFDLSEKLMEVVDGKLKVELPPEPAATFLARHNRKPGDPPPEPVPRVQLLAQIFAAVRAMARAKAGPMPTPEGFWWPDAPLCTAWSGRHWRDRQAAAERARKQFAEALALHHVSATEEAWVAYLAKNAGGEVAGAEG